MAQKENSQMYFLNITLSLKKKILYWTLSDHP